MKKLIALSLSIVVILQSCKKDIQTFTDITNLQQLSVWNKAPFNSFTDLIKYNGSYYCAFREGSTHTSYDGKIRIVTSTDSKTWNSFCLLSLKNEDLRDPHFFIDSNNILSLSTSGRQKNSRENFLYKFQNGTFADNGQINADSVYYLWSFSKFNNSIYSIGYNVYQPCYSTLNSNDLKIRLFKNGNEACGIFDSLPLHSWITSAFVCPSEASMVFTPDSTLIAIVRDQDVLGYSHIGISKYPFTNFTWKKFPYYIRGPKLALLPDGRLFIAGASLINLYETYYAIVNPANDYAVETVKTFPSAGDSGYPGVIIEGNSVLISYYSSHEGNARVYIDRFTY